MTEKLYYKDSYIRDFTARVISCTEGKQGYLVELSQTAFFPEGGGQAADTGYIGEAKVFDVHEKGDRIYHYVNQPLSVGEEYSCSIDWQQRYRRMQNHSGEHIVSGIVHRKYGYNNVGFHMGRDFVTIDFDGDLTKEQLREIEKAANEAVAADLAIRCFFPPAEELKFLDYRSKLELTENVRLVEIEDTDLCACCAPHLKSTAGVGIVKILDAERRRRGGDGVRISMLCGIDAYEYLAEVQENNDSVSTLLSAKRLETVTAVERLLSENEQLKHKNAGLELEFAKRIAAGAYNGSNICVFENCLGEAARRELVNLLMKKSKGIAGVFCGNDESGYSYIIGSENIDLRKHAKAINEALCGRGGGRPEMISGRVSASSDEIENYFRNFDFLT